MLNTPEERRLAIFGKGANLNIINENLCEGTSFSVILNPLSG